MQNLQIATHIKNLCRDNQIPISAFLESCNLRRSLIYDLEKRNTSPSGEVLTKIADYFDISVDYLLGRTDNPNVNK